MTIVDNGFRSIELEGSVHDIDDSKHTVVVDFPFERLDSYRTDFGKGWCDDYLAAHKPVMLVHHNPADLIGHGINYQNMGDRAQLVGQFSDFDANPLAKRYFAHIRDGDIPGWSYNFRNARGIPHPSGQRAAVRYTKADMPEFGPTPFPAIPGAGAVGLRSEETTLSIPTLTELDVLLNANRITEEGYRAALAEHYPSLREHIVVRQLTPEQLALAALKETAATHGLRSMVVTIADDGSVTAGATIGNRATDDEDASQLAQSIDASLDQFQALLVDEDVRSLPANVQQAIDLATAAGVASDELLDVMGIADPDGNRALLGTKDRNDLPDSAFAYIEPGGTKDADGKTVPRSKRHFPIPDADHVRNALSRIGAGAEFGDKAKPKVLAAAKKYGVNVDKSDHGSRSDEPDQATQAEEALERIRALR